MKMRLNPPTAIALCREVRASYSVRARTSHMSASVVVLALCGTAAFVATASAASDRPPAAVATREMGNDARRGAVATYLRHIYSVYLGIRACAEMSTSENDQSFRSEVSLDEARKALRLIDKATAEIGVNSNEIWNAAAPLATATAEALKTNPAKNLPYCHKMGALFRTDASNLQANLRSLGAKTPLIPKDY